MSDFQDNNNNNDLIEFLDEEEFGEKEDSEEKEDSKENFKEESNERTPDDKNRPRYHKIVCAAIVLILAACAAVYVINRYKQDEKEASASAYDEKVYKVSVIEVSPTGNDVYLTYTGIVQPGEMEQAAFSTVGTVKEIYVTEGQEVKKGDLLAALDDADAKRQVENSANNLQIARANLNSAVSQRQKAYDDYVAACSPEDAQKNLEDATARRDAQQEKVNTLSTELVTLETEQEKAKKEYEEAGKNLLTAQGSLSTAETELKALQDAAAGEELIQAKQAEVDAAALEAEECQKIYDDKQNAYTTVQADYRTKQAEHEAAKASLATYNEAVDTAQTTYDNKVEDGPQTADAKAQAERFNTADAACYTAQASYDTASNNYEASLEALEDCKLIAGSDGYVITVAVSEGSFAAPIMPAVVIGSNENVVSFGVSQSDIRDVTAGLAAEITVNGVTFQGEVKKVSLLPDETSRTYNTEVTIQAENAGFYLGEMAVVKIAVGEREGVWLPLSVILNDGQDYVYLVENGRAKRQNVIINEISNDMILVTGIPDGGQVISEGMKLVRTGSPVTVD